MGRRKDGETEAEEGETEREPEKVSGGTETGREGWGGERDQGETEVGERQGETELGRWETETKRERDKKRKRQTRTHT